VRTAGAILIGVLIALPVVTAIAIWWRVARAKSDKQKRTAEAVAATTVLAEVLAAIFQFASLFFSFENRLPGESSI
jgi:predicted signal transduction protein with EAL and GGDEF domain